MIKLLLRQLGRECNENAAAAAVVAAERGLRLIDDLAAGKLRLRSGAQRHGVHVGHEHDPRLVVHRVGTGIRVLASSRRIASAGTPLSCSTAATSRPIAASFPVTPSTARKRMRRSAAA